VVVQTTPTFRPYMSVGRQATIERASDERQQRDAREVGDRWRRGPIEPMSRQQLNLDRVVRYVRTIGQECEWTIDVDVQCT
jgi:hypothetical protein